jgi:hypothetical protein
LCNNAVPGRHRAVATALCAVWDAGVPESIETPTGTWLQRYELASGDERLERITHTRAGKRNRTKKRKK